MRLTKKCPKVIMQLDGERGTTTIDGVLLGKSQGHYVLAAAGLVVDEQSTQPLGETKVPCSRVLFYQVVS